MPMKYLMHWGEHDRTQPATPSKQHPRGHSLRRSGGLLIVGASSGSEVSLSRPFSAGGIRSDYLESANHLLRGAPPFFMGSGALGAALYQAWGVPWLKDDPNQRLMSFSVDEYEAFVAAEHTGGAI